jgi:hypothetical protein
MGRSLSYPAIVLGLSLACGTAFAGDAKKPEPGTTVEMMILIAPMIVDGQIDNYAYISSAILATSPAAAVDIRARVPFIQDAYVRDVNAASIVKAGMPDAVDSDALTARLLACARRIAGAAKVAGVRLTQVQIAPVRTTPNG